jgi:hypothetical protein
MFDVLTHRNCIVVENLLVARRQVSLPIHESLRFARVCADVATCRLSQNEQPTAGEPIFHNVAASESGVTAGTSDFHSVVLDI